MDEIPIISLESVTTSSAKDHINKLYQSLCDSMHEAVQASLFGAVREKKCDSHGKPKGWWNINCIRARNSNRLYHKIWKSCGSPKNGTVYELYMASRRAYRKASRYAIDHLKIRNINL